MLVDESDPRQVIVVEMALQVEGRPDVLMDLSSAQSIEAVKENTFTIKEGSSYVLKVKFKVQNEVVAGLKYLHVIKRKGIKVDKREEMIGSYPPKDEVYELSFSPEEAPSGLLARGKYHVISRFLDDDKNCHMEFDWRFEIKKDWDDAA